MVFNPMPEFFGNSLQQLNTTATSIYDQETVTKMIAEAVKAEREACAKHLDNQNTAITDILAAEIRARGQA